MRSGSAAGAAKPAAGTVVRVETVERPVTVLRQGPVETFVVTRDVTSPRRTVTETTVETDTRTVVETEVQTVTEIIPAVTLTVTVRRK